MAKTLRTLTDPDFTTKGNTLTWAELDQTFIDIWGQTLEGAGVTATPTELNRLDGNLATVRSNIGLGSGDNVTHNNLTLTGYVDLDQISTPSNPSGNIARIYNVAEGGFSTLHYVNSSGIDFEISRDSVHIVRNETGAVISKGDLVYINGANGNFPTVALADASSASTMPVFGMVVADISDNSFGEVVTEGDVSGVDTSSFNQGDTLFADTTAGGLTTTEPTGDNIPQVIGTVIKANVSGIIEVKQGTVYDFVKPNLNSRLATLALGGSLTSGSTLTVNGKSYIQESSTGGSPLSGFDTLTVERSGNVGIQLLGTGTAGVFFGDASANNVGSIQYQHSSDRFVFVTSGSTAGVINSSQNWGIGTTSVTSGSTLTLAGDQDFSAANSAIKYPRELWLRENVWDASDYMNVRVGQSAGSEALDVQFHDDSAGTDDVLMRLRNNSSFSSWINVDGPFGIGTTMPTSSSTLTINGDVDIPVLATDTFNASAFEISDGSDQGFFFGQGTGSGFIPIIQAETQGDSSDEALFIAAQITPANDTGSAPVIEINARQNDTTDITTRDLLRISNNGTYQFYFTSGGALGIGSSPNSGSTLTVNGTTDITDADLEISGGSANNSEHFGIKLWTDVSSRFAELRTWRGGSSQQTGINVNTYSGGAVNSARFNPSGEVNFYQGLIAGSGSLTSGSTLTVNGNQDITGNLNVNGGLFTKEWTSDVTRVMLTRQIGVGGGVIGEVVDSTVGAEIIKFHDENGNEIVPVADNDMIRIQVRTGVDSGTVVKSIKRKVVADSQPSNEVSLTTTGVTTGTDTGTIAEGDHAVVTGNTSNTDRDGLIEVNVADIPIPAFRFLDGITDFGGGTEAMRVGGLDPGGSFEYDSSLTGDLGIAGKIGGSLAFALTEDEGLIGTMQFDGSKMFDTNDRLRLSGGNGLEFLTGGTFGESRSIDWWDDFTDTNPVASIFYSSASGDIAFVHQVSSTPTVRMRISGSSILNLAPTEFQDTVEFQSTVDFQDGIDGSTVTIADDASADIFTVDDVGLLLINFESQFGGTGHGAIVMLSSVSPAIIAQDGTEFEAFSGNPDLSTTNGKVGIYIDGATGDVAIENRDGATNTFSYLVIE